MSTQDDPMGAAGGRPPTEEELRAAYEAELKRLRVEEVIVQTVVSLLNLGGRKAGLVPGSEEERDPEQLRLAVDGTRALLPLVEDVLGPDASQLRDAVSQLQLAYTRMAGAGAAEGGGEPAEGAQPGQPSAGGQPRQPGDAERSGRLWIPGQ
jgi:hypothetical protein